METPPCSYKPLGNFKYDADYLESINPVHDDELFELPVMSDNEFWYKSNEHLYEV